MPEKKKARHSKNARGGARLYRAAFLAVLALVVLAAVYIVKFYRERSETEALNAQLHALLVTAEPSASAQPSPITARLARQEQRPTPMCPSYFFSQ